MASRNTGVALCDLSRFILAAAGRREPSGMTMALAPHSSPTLPANRFYFQKGRVALHELLQAGLNGDRWPLLDGGLESEYAATMRSFNRSVRGIAFPW